MAGLGGTTDPRALVPGDPGGIEDKAATLRKEAESYGTAKDDLRTVDTGNWWGQASTAFWDVVSKEPPKWSAVCDSVDTTSGALTEYAGVLRWAQEQASEAVGLWERGEEATRQAAADRSGSSSSTQASDPGDQYRQRAQALLANAREQLAAAATRAAGVIRGDGSNAGALDHFVDEITGGWKSKGSADVSGPTAGVSASGPQGSKMGELKAFAELAKAEAKGSVGNEYVQLSGKAAATVAAEASLAGAVNNEGVSAKAEVMAGAKASAQGKVEFGPYAGYNGKVEGFAGASASASASAGLGGLNANAEAFAGAKAKGQIGGDVAGIGLNATAEGWAGAGASAGVNFGPDQNGTWHIGVNAGVAPGLGGKLGVELTVDPDDVAATATDAAKFVGDATAATGEAIGDAASDAYDTATFWN